MDWIWLGILLSGLVFVIFISEIVRKKRLWTIKVTRKFVHILTGIFIAFAPFLMSSSYPLLIVAGSFVIFNLIAIKNNWMPGMHATDKISYGTVFYPISFFLLIALLWNGYKSILVVSMLIMAIADAVAAMVGESIRNPKTYQFSGEKKSVQGSLAMFLATLLITFVGLKFFLKFDNLSITWFHAFWFSVITALVATGCESLSFKGSDNLSVPLGAAFIIHYLVTHSTGHNLAFTYGIGLALFIAVISIRFRFLGGSGSVATFLLGAVVFGIGKWEFSLPILLFFILSSLLSKFGKKQKKKFEDTFQKGGKRDLGQVFANGGVAGIMVILWNFFPHAAFYFAFVGSIAAVTADTWGTEIGVFSKIMPRNIINFKKVAPGTSGGITYLGFLGGFIGSFLIVYLGKLVTNRYDSLPAILPWLLVVAGLFGSAVDSFVGATVQAQFRCPNCGKITEKRIHCGSHETTLYSGFKLIDNDIVNTICALSGAGFAWLAYLILVR